MVNANGWSHGRILFGKLEILTDERDASMLQRQKRNAPKNQKSKNHPKYITKKVALKLYLTILLKFHLVVTQYLLQGRENSMNLKKKKEKNIKSKKSL